MLTRECITDGRTKRFTVEPSPDGWRVREELDRQLVRSVHCSDWHRVERALIAFERSGQLHSTNR